MNDRNLLWRVSHRELKIVPSDLPLARFRDPKEGSRRDRLALIANLDWGISDNDVFMSSI